MKHGCILFDYGGTIAYRNVPVAVTDELFAEAAVKYLGSRGITFDACALSERISAVSKRFIEREEALNIDIPDLERFIDLSATAFTGISEAESRDIALNLNELFWSMVEKAYSPLPGAHEVLEYVKHRSIRMGIVSNHHNGASLRNWLKHSGMLSYFETVTVSSEVGCRKPDPRIFRMTLEKMDCEASLSLFVGDSPVMDVAGASAVGMKSVLTNQARILHGAEDMHPSVQPDFIIGSLSELRTVIDGIEFRSGF